MTMASTVLNNLQPKQYRADAVFGLGLDGCPVMGFSEPTPYTPAKDDNYLFHQSSVDIALWFVSSTEPLYVFGPTGSGKTSCINQFAARLNYPVFESTGHSRLEFPELVGHLTVRAGIMEFDYGPLTLAMKYGGIFLLNEIDLLEPATSAGLNSVLDGHPLCIAENGGELITPHPMFRFVATANSNGASDETGLYQGVQRQNLAFMDRFWLCKVDYPSAQAEESLLGKIVPDIPTHIINKMVQFAGDVRRQFIDEADNENVNGIEVTFSTRTLIRWAKMLRYYRLLYRDGYKAIPVALDRALGFRATRETRAMLHELAQRTFDF